MTISRDEIQKSATAYHTVGDVEMVNVDGVSCAVWRAGSGEKTLVMIHGNSACKEVFFNQMQAMSESGYNCLAIDLPGHGGTSDAASPETQYTIGGYALLIKRVLDALEVTNYTVLGWSLGGHIGLEMAGRGFDLAGLMITGTPPCGPGPAEVMDAFLPVEAGAVTMAAEATDAQLQAYAKAVYGTLDPLPEFFVDAARRTDGIARATMGANIIAGEEGCHQRTVAAGWAKPMAVGHGRLDPFISFEYLQSVDFGNLFDGEIHIFENSGHAPFLECPDEFNTFLSRFLKAVYA